MAKGNYNRKSEPHGGAGFEPMFETNFAADENSLMDFKNESFGSDWDANRPFEQDVISPSSLHSFSGPRKATAVHSKWVNASSKEFNQFDKGKKTLTAEPSPRVVADSLPFRDRFASAAMVSQQANASFQLEESFRSQEEISPKKLFSSPIGDKSSGPLSPVHNNDEEYVSFGNQSVFSDITEFEMSVNASCPSPSRDLRRKARQSRNIANRSPPRQHLGKVPEDESAKGMRRESDTSMESESDPDNEKKGTLASPATAFAKSVLPVPGGPTSNAPLGILPPKEVYLSGFLKKSTISSTSSFAPSKPATSLNDVLVSVFSSNNLALDLPILKICPPAPPPPPETLLIINDQTAIIIPKNMIQPRISLPKLSSST